MRRFLPHSLTACSPLYSSRLLRVFIMIAAKVHFGPEHEKVFYFSLAASYDILWRKTQLTFDINLM